MNYLNLIQKLINCTSKQEAREILRNNNNFDLFDVDFLRILQQEAVRLQQEGDSDKSDFLKDIVKQLIYFLGVEEENLTALITIEAAESSKEQADRLFNKGIEQCQKGQITVALNSWKKTLIIYREIRDIHGEANSLGSLGSAYRLLGRNSQAIGFYNQCLTLAKKIEDREIEANSLDGLGDVYYSLGEYQTAIDYHEKSLELERQMENRLGESISLGNLGTVYHALGKYQSAINYHKQHLYIAKEIGHKKQIASSSQNLGNDYIILGEYETAIDYLQQSLEISKKIGDRLGEANSLGSLGLVYYSLGKFRKAKDYYEKSLAIAKQIEARQTERTVLGNLGNAYLFLGEYETAIDYQKQSLEISKEMGDRQGKANSLGDLGLAYYLLGQHEKAINYHEQSLEIAKEIEDKQSEANSLLNLGDFYHALGNYQEAIYYQEQSLEIAKEIGDKQGEASSLNSLGNAYSFLEEYQKAIKYLKQSLDIAREIGDKKIEANSLGDLGNIYYSLGKYLKVVEYEKQSLIIAKEIGYKKGKAVSLMNLGEAYNSLGKYQQAITYFQDSLKIATPTTMPVECFKAGRNLGNAAFTQKNWQLAISGYAIAIKAGENSRSQAISEIRRQEIMAEAIGVYQNIVQSYINLQQLDKAIEYAERSKTRDLVELLAKRDLSPKGDIPQTVIIELNRLRKEIVTEDKQLAAQEMSDNRAIMTSEGRLKQYQPQIPDRRKLNQLKQQLEELINRDISPIDPTFSLTQKVEPISFNEIKTLTTENAAIIQWYITNDKILTFIITADSHQPIIKQFPSEDRQALIDEINNYLNLYLRDKKEKTEKWQNQLESILENCTQYLHLGEIISQLPQECNSLILIPHRFIHLLPIHALKATRKQEEGITVTGYLLDLFHNQISYAPSCQLLQLVKNQKRDKFNNLFGIQNPTEDLQYTDIEVNTIRQLFKPNDNVLVKDNATKESLNQQNLNQTSYSHFSSHGYFNFQEPLKSALILANSITQKQENKNPNSENFTRSPQNEILDLEKCLTLGDIFNLDLRNCSLVTLSACETGLTDLRNVSDEYISLPSGFLFAGSTNVVSSLWAVNDLSTAFLMIKFYQNHKQENLPVTKALNEAQKWLRDITKLELQSWIEENKLSLSPAVKITLLRYIRQFSDDCPFKEPYYWAAFYVIGK